MDYDALIADLFHEDRNIHESARLTLLDAGEAALPALTSALRSPDPINRQRIVALLGKLENIRATPLLVNIISQDNDAEVRLNAIVALSQLEDVRAIDPLIVALSDPAASVRQVSARILGEYGVRRAIEPLRALLADDDEQVRRRAAWVLGNEFLDSYAVEMLLPDLTHSDTRNRLKAIQALGKLEEVRAVDGLITCLIHPEAEIRKAAAFALAQIGAVEATGDLLFILEHDSEDEVRAQAARSLGKTGTSEVISALHEALEDHDQAVRGAAAYALGDFADEESVMSLLTLLQGQTVPETRKQVAWTLGKIGSNNALRALTLLLEQDNDYGVQYEVMLIFAKLGITGTLLNLLAHPSYLIRQGAAKSLGLAHDESAVGELARLLEDSDLGVRQAAAAALLRINHDFVNEALSLLIQDLFHGSYEVCWYTLRTLQELPDHRFLNPVIAVVDDDDANTRALAAGVLANLDDPRSIDALIPLLQDEDWGVRRATRLALIKLGYGF